MFKLFIFSFVGYFIIRSRSAFNASALGIKNCKFPLSQKILIAADISGLDKKCANVVFICVKFVMSKNGKNIGDKTSTNAIMKLV